MDFNSKKIFVGNLPFSISKEELESMFSPHGSIIGVNVREDRLTGKPKGFAFVTYETDEEATRAIAAMNNYSYGGRTLTVNQASIRGSDAKNPDRDVDNSWKTVPTLAPSARGKKTDTKDGKKATGIRKCGTKEPATWDHWAGPVVKAPAVKDKKAAKVVPMAPTEVPVIIERIVLNDK